ncbi:MAG: Mur ligase family protein, partial [Chitinophagales bacterium]
MPLLQYILYKVNNWSVLGQLNVPFVIFQIDSRKTNSESVFIAVKGVSVDGHQFIESVADKGVIAVICERFPERFNPGITYVQVENSAVAAGIVAHNFFGQPSEHLKLIGVTGTNGKTTIATLLYKLFSALGYTCGLLSTVQNLIGQRAEAATHTTPDAIGLNGLLKQMVDAGCTHAFMETSSHAIDQHRIAGLRYTGALFSNITHDHLDYHKT